MLLRVVFLLVCLTVCGAVPILKYLSWLPLPDGSNQSQPFLGTADRAAWDGQEQYLYVIGSKAETLHIVDLINHSNPKIVFSRTFNKISDGKPKAIAMCRNGPKEEVVIAFSAKERLLEGHVEVFRPWQRFDHTLPLLVRHATKPDPSAVKFDKYCAHFVVTCQGLPGSRNNIFEDPVAHVDVFQAVPDGWQAKTVNFVGARGLDKARYVFKDGNNNQPIVVEDLEPTDLVIDDDSQVYVTLHKNNAIAKFNLLNTEAGVDIYTLGTKDWNSFDSDTSDRDIAVKPDRVNMVRHNIRSFYQPKRLAMLHFDNDTFLLSANTGGIKTYTAAVDGVDFSEAIRARLMNESLLDPSFDAATKASLKDDAMLGRLFISTLQQESDGWDDTFDFLKQAYAYGARSWGIWNVDGVTQMYDSGDSLEYHASLYSRNVFNGDCLSPGSSPPQQLDTRSDDMGPEPSSISTGMFNGEHIVVVGSGRMGGIWLYSVVEGEAPGIVTANYESYLRLGDINGDWGQLYSSGTAGVQYISDILIVDHHNHQMVIAVGSQMGAVAVFEITDSTSP